MNGGMVLLAAAAAVVLALLARRFTETPAPRPEGWTPARPPMPSPSTPSGGTGTSAGPEEAIPEQPWDGWDDEAAPIRVEGGRVPVTHPMIRQAAEAALARGGDAARSFVREGEMIYATFAGIPDPRERALALDVLLRVQSGEEVGLDEVVWLVRRLTGQG